MGHDLGEPSVDIAKSVLLMRTGTRFAFRIVVWTDYGRNRLRARRISRLPRRPTVPPASVGRVQSLRWSRVRGSLRTGGAGELPLSEFHARFCALIDQWTDDGENIVELAGDEARRWRHPKNEGVARVDTSFIWGLPTQRVMTDAAGFAVRAIGRESVHRDLLLPPQRNFIKLLCEGMMRQPQVCDHCGGRFGLVTHRWWSNRFCKRACKDAHLRELAIRRDQIRRWYGFLRGQRFQNVLPPNVEPGKHWGDAGENIVQRLAGIKSRR